MFSLEVIEREWNDLDGISWRNNPLSEDGGTKPLMMESSTNAMLCMFG
jgi:hypothetical protein